MSIKMRIPVYYLEYCDNKDVVDVDGNSVLDCMNSLADQFDKFKDVVSSGLFDIYTNNDNPARLELHETVNDGDELILVRGGT